MSIWRRVRSVPLLQLPSACLLRRETRVRYFDCWERAGIEWSGGEAGQRAGQRVGQQAADRTADSGQQTADRTTDSGQRTQDRIVDQTAHARSGSRPQSKAGAIVSKRSPCSLNRRVLSRGLCHSTARPRQPGRSRHKPVFESKSAVRPDTVRSSGVPRTLDMTRPELWYPKARQMVRQVIVHMGPTNSGKTYQALQAFKNSQGLAFYAGPLRLLAREVYQRVKDEGRPCNLKTGEEVILEDNARMTSGTVEMVPVNTRLDVLVLDEVQMIGDEQRGFAWTAAYLGACAAEIHLCGDDSMLRVLKRMARACGDVIEVRKYTRLSPLKLGPALGTDFLVGQGGRGQGEQGGQVGQGQGGQEQKGQRTGQKGHGGHTKLRPGDCIVAFKKRSILDWKLRVQAVTGRKCAVIYGSLPPEVRAHQARLFNDPDNDYKYLVASDAIGMGLNLAIQRVIFSQTVKFNGIETVQVPPGQIRQIGGRAGRYRVAGAKSADMDTDTDTSPLGEVCGLTSQHTEAIETAFGRDLPSLERVGVFPCDEVLRRMVAMKKRLNVSLAKLLDEVSHVTEVGDNFFLVKLDQITAAAAMCDRIPNLSFEEKLVLCKAPVRMDLHEPRLAFWIFCQTLAAGDARRVLDYPELKLHRLNNASVAGMDTVLENMYRNINLFLWLSCRFPDNFLDRRSATDLRLLCEARIKQGLAAVPRR